VSDYVERGRHREKSRHPDAESPAPAAESPVAEALGKVTVPDLWQQQAVAALRAGKDVVVQAPTGSGKTLIFELWSNGGKNRGQAIYTVPTRALANDKLAEWRSRGWNVGIATGDLSENLDAPVIVATLETQKNRLIRGDGPTLLVIDEYQMLADPDRGLNYELAMALAPEHTRLLMLSGSVANPHHIVQWLNRLGRPAVLVRHEIRPVPLEEVNGHQLSYNLPSSIRGYWSRFCTKALAESLGPILLFAPRRANAEAIAAELSRELPNPNPLLLSEAQRRIVGDHLARLLKARVAYHHSGLSYAARAGVIEPLAKAGQLRVVVATMGLAAGINFSLRSVALTAGTYRRDGQEIPLRPDEILQMFGRAGRRGLDESGYVLVSANEVRLRDGHAAQLARSGMVDWSALLTLMAAAAEQGKEPFAEAVRVQERLFTTKPIFLGVEFSLKHPNAPCGLMTDSERARHVRRRVKEMLNSRGEWQAVPAPSFHPLSEVRQVLWHGPVGRPGEPAVTPLSPKPRLRPKSVGRVRGEAAVESTTPSPSTPPAGEVPLWSLRLALSEPAALEKIGQGELVVLEETPAGPILGRESVVGDRHGEDTVILAKWVRRLTNWNGRQASLSAWRESVVPLIQREMAAGGFPVDAIVELPDRIVVQTRLDDNTVRAWVDAHGVPLWRPPEREIVPDDCGKCDWITSCRSLSAGTGTALLWRRLALVDEAGVPTRRGRVVSCFSSGDGLAVAAGLEDSGYPLDDLLFDLANLDAGFRFCSSGDRWEGRLAMACRAKYGSQNISGYLENGVPPKYGSGAETVVRSVQKDPYSKHRFVTEFLGDGDIDRIIIEWRSMLRQIANAPAIPWERWTALQKAAKSMLQQTESPTDTDLPALEFHQTKRVDHRLSLRRH
jgi:superfamily II DNA/RNA helicase